MSGTAPSADPRSRSKPKKRRFGFFNLFGLSTDSETTDSDNIDFATSLKSNQDTAKRIQSQRSGLGITDNSNDNGDDNVANTRCDQSNPTDVSSSKVVRKTTTPDSHDTALATPASRPIIISKNATAASNRPEKDGACGAQMRGVASSEHYGYPRSISLDIRDVSSDSSSSSSSSSRSNISSRISRQFEPSLPPLSLGDSRILHGQNASKPIDRDSGNIGTSVSMIRTCPIPERLRLHKKDIQDYSAENSSPGQIVSSANTLADSPRTLPDHGVHRRATVSTSSTGGTLDADRRNAPRTPDQPLSMKKPSVISASPRNEKQHPTKTLSSVAPGSAARRTSSTNSSWSVATPTSASDIAGDNAVAPGTMLCGGYSAFLPDWEPVSTGQQQMQAPLTPYPLRSRTKGRRYSVFDVSFANQPRSEGNAGNYNYSGGVPMPIPQTTPIHARRLHKMDSSKVFTGEEDTLSAHELSSFGQSSNASPRRLRSHSHAAKPFLRPNAQHDSKPNMSIHSHPHEDTSFVPLRRYSQQSHGSLSTFSSQGNMLDETSQEPGKWQSATDEKQAGSNGKNSSVSSRMNLPHNRHFFTEYHEHSSGQSTPSQTPFTPPPFGRSRGIVPANAFDAVSKAQSPQALREAGRSRAGSIAIITSNHTSDLWNYHDIHGSDQTNELEDSDKKAPTFLRCSTSMPDFVVTSAFSCFEEYEGSLKRPDYYYEQILDSSRNAKAGRWRVHSAEIEDNTAHSPQPCNYSSMGATHATAIDHVSVDHATNIGKQSGDYLVSGSRIPNVEAATVPFPTLKNTCTSPHCVDIDPARNIRWNGWTDELNNRPETPVTAQAVYMWQRILRNWRYRHRGGSDLFGHRCNGSASYISNSDMQRTPRHIKAADFGHDTIARGTDIGVGSPLTSNAPAILSPYIIEPTYLQRGSSETGRYDSPVGTLAPLYSLGSHSQASRARHPGVFLEHSEGSPSTTTASQQAWGSDASCADGGKQDLSPFSASEPKPTAFFSTVDENSQMLQPAPHRRLSVIKSQELGIHRAPNRLGYASTQDHSSVASDKTSRSTARACAASAASRERQSTGDTNTHAFSGAAEKQPIVIAQLEPPDQVVDTLYSFYTRLRLRLEKAKAESESELLRIIQDLGGFVEDGLRYVNEDSDPSDPESVHGVAHCATAISEKEASYISGDDEDGTHTPGLVIARKSLSDQHSKNYFQDGPTDSGSYLLPFEPEMRGYSRSSARLGLECLNGRLHDMLDLHDSRVEESSGRASSAEPGSYATHDVATSQIELDSSEQSRPHGKLVKAPSIRRLAVLKTLAGGADNAFVPGVDQSRHHVDKRRSRVVTAQLAQESKFEVGALDASRSVSPDIPELESRRYSLDRSSVTERRPSQASVHSIGSRSSLAASPLIEEDRFKPTPLIEAIMDLVNIIGCVINLSADDMLHPISSQLLDETLESANETAACFNAEEERERVLSMMPTEYIVQQLNALGSMWQRSSLFLGNIDTEQQQQQRQQPWPCRGLFFRALLSISSLNRIVMWYVAVRSTYSEDVIEQLDKRTQVDSFTGSPEQGPGLVNDSLSDNQTQSDTASVPSLPYIYTDSPSSPGISSSAMTSKDVVHNTPPKPRGIVKASIASSSGLYQDESQQASTDIISSNNSTDSQVYDASRPPQWNKAASSILDTAVFDKGLNMLLEVALDGRIRYISPTCRQLLGIDPESVVDLPTTAIFDTEDAQVCRSAVEQLLADSTRTVEIGVKVHGPGSSIVVDVEAKGMLMYSRTRNEPSHVLWVLRYVPSKLLVRNAQMDASTYSLDSKAGLANDGHVLPVFELITCRICDMSVPVTYFEEHTWLCAKSHRAAMDVCRQNDRLSDLKTEIQAWYPSCDVNDLEAFVHGEIDSEALREKTENRAAEIGGPAWQSLVKEATTVTISMLDICSQAIAVDENDAVPICELPGPTDRGRVSNLSSDGINNSKDFVRSRLWTKVEYYQPPSPEYTDDSLMAIQILLLDAIKAKLDAVDALQYAIIDSSVALSRWVPPECELVDNNACLHSERPLDDQNVVSTGSQNDNDLKGTSENVGVVLDTADICGLGDGSEYRQALPKDTSHIQNTRSTCAYLKPATVPPATQRPSGISDAASNAGQLRILTKDLHPAPSRSQTRSSISSNALLATPTMPTISDFALLKPISKGAYGSVYLAKKRTTGEYYAIKVLRKADMIAKNQISNVKAERAIMMAQTGSPFVVRLLYTFQSRTNLYLVMEYLNGGDCASLLKAIGTLPEGWARQYLAEVVLGIQDLHTRNVVHRDLKPDNLLIDSEGHLKLTDFGLSKLGFLGRRVDQQTANNPLQSDDTPARQPCTQKAKGTFSSGGSLLPLSTSSIPGLTQPLPSSIPYSIYSQGTDTCSISSHDERHFGDVPFAVPSIVTPPTIKNDTYQHLDSAHSSQVSSASRPIADIIPSKRVAALKPASDKSSLSDSNGGCEAPSTSSSASLRSVGFDAVAPPSHHKHALGTPDYIAPESILGLEAGKDVDWWALGIICYEFIFGIPPFHDETPEKVFKNILSAETDFYDDLHDQLEAKRKQPSKSTDDICSSFGEDGYDDDEPDVPSISPEIRDFITKLLCRDPKQRLGHNGAEEVKAHPMFRGIDWNTLLETQASFIPNVENIEDTDYFDSRGATMNDNESMDRLEGKLDERHVRGKPSISGVVDTHVQDTRLHAITIPELDTNSENRVSKSHEVQSDISNPVCRVPISRAKTLPAILDDDDLYNEASSANSETNNDSNVPQVLSPELPTSKGIKDLKDIHGQKHSQHLPPVDDTPDSDFGVFTFKNLHALEQANMNELVKLRRRSTMLDVSGAPPVQSSFSFGSSSPTSPSPLARTTHRYSHTGISFGGDVDSSGITSSSSNSNIALQPYQMIPARKLLSTQVLHNTEHQASRPENATSPYQQRYSYDHQLPFTTAAHKDHHLHMSDRLPLFGASPEAPSSDAPDSGPPATQYGYGHRKSLLNPDARLPFHSYKPPVASHGSDIYRPATTSDLDSEIHISYDEPKEPAYTQSSICLVADDNPVCCKVMEVMLRRLHLQCVIVRNGAEALRCAMGRTAFRAIFMDTGMPIVDGDEATRMIKSTYNINKNTPVIAMTTYEGEAADALYDGSIVKPATLQHVKKSLAYTD